jgi:chemotaxis protein histidine kinase CheA
LHDRIGTREVPDDSGGLVAAAERNLALMADDYRGWLEEEAAALEASWDELAQDPSSPAAFRRYHRAIHAMLGNAGTLGCHAATRIANPICRLFERAPDIERHVRLIGLATASIIAAIEEDLGENDPRVVEAAQTLEAFLCAWIGGLGQTCRDSERS